MTDTELDRSLIGPLSGSRIDRDPVKWGTEPVFVVSDRETEEYVRREVERYSVVASHILRDEFRSLIQSLSSSSEPTGVLHGLIVWGPATVPKIAGYLGRAVPDVSSHMKALEFLGVVRATEDYEFGDVCFAVDPAADVLSE